MLAQLFHHCVCHATVYKIMPKTARILGCGSRFYQFLCCVKESGLHQGMDTKQLQKKSILKIVAYTKMRNVPLRKNRKGLD